MSASTTLDARKYHVSKRNWESATIEHAKKTGVKMSENNVGSQVRGFTRGECALALALGIVVTLLCIVASAVAS
jgi:hypothetical protein